MKLIFLTIMLLCVSLNNTMKVNAAEIVDNQGNTVVEQSTEEVINDNRMVVMIKNTSFPKKLTYTRGESLDLTGLVVQAYYDDGTEAPITDYQVIGYNSDMIGSQTIIVLYQNKLDIFTINVIPEKVTNIKRFDNYESSFMLYWDPVKDASRYEIYCLDVDKNEYVLQYVSYGSSITLSNITGAVQGYKIKAIVNVMGVEYQSELSDPFLNISKPEAVTSISVIATTSKTVRLSWTGVNNATGYIVYRSLATKDDYKLVKVTSDLEYTDTGLTAATGYKYKVCAYVYSQEYIGDFSPVIDVSTSPATPTLKFKAGEGKVRLTWNAVSGANSYEIYIGSAGNDFVLLTTTANGSGGTYIAENLTTGETYQFYIVARKLYKDVIYYSDKSEIKTVYMSEIEPTSTTALLYPTEEAFYNSWSYQKLTFFSQYVNYSKSYVIPGLITTNVGGFSSTRMCPQGLTFAGNYLLMSAYDLSGEENSVIYVMDKSTKELLTTVVLPGKPHAGGLAYDGSNIWVTIGTRVAAIKFSDFKNAAKSGEPYVFVDYSTIISVGITASYAAFYDEKLWVGTYNELQATNMYSFIIEDKETNPKFTKKDTILMPNRVQGVAFTDIGTLIISRSCQIHSGMRGYLRQLDVYKPDYSNAVDGVISLGNLVNSVSVPSMNEGIAINGNYLYVLYETGAFEASVYKMDHITAFKLTDVVKKKAK